MLSWSKHLGRHNMRRRVLAGVAFLVAGVPMLAFIAFRLLVSGFIPSTKLEPVADFTAPLAGIAFLAITWPAIIADVRSHWLTRRFLKSASQLACMPFMPFLGWLLLQVFFAGPASYSLHRLTAGAPTIHIENALRAHRYGGHGGRACRTKVILEGSNSFIWKRVLCGVSDEAVAKLAQGGRISLEGTESAYGSQPTKYQIHE